MGGASRVSRWRGNVQKRVELTWIAVFSAPKYCDSTENKGALINIGPDYKLVYKQFENVPHPDIKPMACK